MTQSSMGPSPAMPEKSRVKASVKAGRHHFYASLIAAAVLGAALALLWLGQQSALTTAPKLMVREVTTVSLPPPPPPASMQAQMPETPIAVAVEGAGAAMELSLEVPTPAPLNIRAPEPVLKITDNFEADLSVDWQAFGLDELDGLPSLLTQVKTAFPAALARKGVERAVVRLDVFIDESGKPTLVAIADNPHPELDDAINKLLRGSRFSPPTRGGVAVKARFIWPVEFKKS
ncbi:energy transducer TonB [Shewanella sp. JM162201]|uniref:Energy transducer TonB n=1 Tax=Shewanella jiangmenensis TaxID=2837387 RepID=A0ABS5V1S8_9GAMM|nr:TonB family protein [Shewanella jiangmenensis]MBT1443777.1 energy transducer TonB [Shewanella jiangmenensis]